MQREKCDAQSPEKPMQYAYCDLNRTNANGLKTSSLNSKHSKNQANDAKKQHFNPIFILTYTST